MKNPETTLEELTRVRAEQQVTRRALIALCVADDAHTAARARMMSAPLHQAIDESENEDRTAIRLKGAVTLCVELGRSLKDSLGEDVDGRAICPHEDAVKWNPYNGVVQCHRCGETFK